MLKAIQLEDIMILIRKALTFNPSHRSQAHCLAAQADTQPKPAKELALSTYGERVIIKNETLTKTKFHGR